LIIFRENTVLKRNGNNEYCKWRRIYIFNHTTPNYSYNEKYFSFNIFCDNGAFLEQRGEVLYYRIGHRWQRYACALLAG
jgi:hypothetical protein